MGLDSGWRHSQKRWVEYLEDFEKDSVEFRPWCWEVGVRPWCWEVGVRPWCWEVGVRTWCREIEIGPCRQTIEFLPLGHREFSFLPLSWVFYRSGGGQILRVPNSEDEFRSKIPRDVPNVGYCWHSMIRKTFKNCVSLLVSKNRSHKLINAVVLEQRSRLCICFRLSIYIWLYLYMNMYLLYCCYWYHQILQHIYIYGKNWKKYYIMKV